MNVGGSGVSRDVAWDVGALLEYHFNQTCPGVSACRLLGINHSDDGILIDTRQNGLPFAAGIPW
jgi:hypothetical protein